MIKKRKLKSPRGKPSESRVRAHGIVESFDVGKNSVLSSRAGIVMMEMDEFTFETTEEILSNSVVVRVALTGHTLSDMKLSQALTKGVGSILNPPVRMENEVMLRSLTANRHI